MSVRDKGVHPDLHRRNGGSCWGLHRRNGLRPGMQTENPRTEAQLTWLRRLERLAELEAAEENLRKLPRPLKPPGRK